MRMLFVIMVLLGLSTACWAKTSVAVVPEPSSVLALAGGAIGLGMAMWRSRR